MCLLDASKAFDRVSLLVLFLKLYVIGLSPSYLRFTGFIQRTKNASTLEFNFQ